MYPKTSEHQALIEAGEALRDFYERSNRLVDRLLSAEGTSFARVRMMSFIERHGSVRSIDLMQAFSYAPRTITEAIDLLERDGLAQRVQDTNDRRAKNISLTPAGTALLRVTEPTLGKFGEQMFDVLGTDDRRQLASLLKRLNSRLDAMDKDGGTAG